MEKLKRLFCSLVICSLLLSVFSLSTWADSSELAYSIRFLPTAINVNSSDIEVEGYFLNLSTQYEVGNFRDFEMDVYKHGQWIASGEFGTINRFMVPPCSVYFQSFTYNSGYSQNLKQGSYDCNDSYYAVIGANFSSQSGSQSGVSTYSSSAANTSTPDLLHYVPTKIEITRSKVVVSGYFVNLDPYKTVSNFTEVNMTFYESGDELISGDFGTINAFSVPPLGVKYQTFTFNGDYTDSLNIGTYNCNDDVYCTFGCRYSSSYGDNVSA